MASTSVIAEPRHVDWRTATLFLLTGAVLILCGLMLRPFTAAITGAITLAVITRRPSRWLRTKIANRNLAATVAILIVTASIIAPATLVVQNLSRHALAGAKMMQDGRVERGLDSVLQRYPQIAQAWEHSSEYITLGEATEKAAGFAASHLVSVFSNSFAALAEIVIMLFLLFFLYRDEEVGVHFLYRLLPLRAGEASGLLDRLASTIRAIVLGRLMIATVQGVIAGSLFAVLGTHAGTILGILTALAAIVPGFGAYVIWLPVAAFLAFTGHWVKAVILIGIGTLVISTLDNFLYPVLVGAQLRQHTISIFLSLLGGVWLFGVSGLVLGPVLFSAADFLLTAWSMRKVVRAEAPAGGEAAG
jgi:predicted PurR-regulated permease PerM